MTKVTERYLLCVRYSVMDFTCLSPLTLIQSCKVFIVIPISGMEKLRSERLSDVSDHMAIKRGVQKSCPGLTPQTERDLLREVNGVRDQQEDRGQWRNTEKPIRENDLQREKQKLTKGSQRRNIDPRVTETGRLT